MKDIMRSLVHKGARWLSNRRLQFAGTVTRRSKYAETVPNLPLAKLTTVRSILGVHIE